MGYEVLARKWRPADFSEVLGQAHVVRALANGLDNDRVHHAFLFTGTRGVGKTTLARILAKSLNCERGVSSKPCGECGACAEIAEGRYVDLIEVDAASRTKVDETRELLDNVQYAPTKGRYKVYLIDEVHMFSMHSFNALLKTLEEPPPHVKFLLATTDPQKLPITILSRCLQFNLKRLPADEMARYLSRILESESVGFEPEAVLELSRAADGSMRDALSLLDQAIAFGAGEVKVDDVAAMLGSLDREKLAALFAGIGRRDADAVMVAVEAMAESAPDYGRILQQLAAMLHQVALVQAVPDALDESAPNAAVISEYAGKIGPEDIQLYYQIAVHGQRDLPLAPDPRTGLEMTLLRMLAFQPLDNSGVPPAGSAGGPKSAAVARTQPAPVSTREASASGNARAPASVAAGMNPGAAGVAVTGTGGTSPPAAIDDWTALIEQLPLRGPSRELAANTHLVEMTDSVVRLGLSPRHAQYQTESAEARLGQALGEWFKRKIKLLIETKEDNVMTAAIKREAQAQERQESAEQSIENDPTVQALQETMGATVVPNSIRPFEDPK